MVFGLKLGGLGGGRKAPAESEEPQLGGRGGTLTVNEFVARAKRGRERGLEPTKPELVAYARYLGIDPVTDGDLLWIAEEALKAPLPSEWTEHHDSADRVFYYNVVTHASSWVHPLEQVHRDTYRSIVASRGGDKGSNLEAMRRECEQSEREAHQELHMWTEHTDDQGSKFYFNPQKQQSVWTDPRPAICHVLYLKMKALRTLSQHCGQPLASPRGPDPLSLGGRDDLRGGGELRPKGRSSNSSPPLAAARDESPAPADGKKRKKKKKHRDEDAFEPPAAPDQRPRAPQEFGGSSSSAGGGLLPAGGGLGNVPRGGSVADEVRGAMGLGGPSLPPLGGPPRGRLDFDAGPPGLSQVGRAKVRAGIKLDPLN